MQDVLSINTQHVPAAYEGHPGEPDRLRLEANPYAFLPTGLTPALRQFWEENFGTDKQVSWNIFANRLLACNELRSLVQQLDTQLRKEHSVTAAIADAASQEGGVFMHTVLRTSLDLDGDGAVQASGSTACSQQSVSVHLN